MEAGTAKVVIISSPFIRNRSILSLCILSQLIHSRSIILSRALSIRSRATSRLITAAPEPAYPSILGPVVFMAGIEGLEIEALGTDIFLPPSAFIAIAEANAATMSVAADTNKLSK